MAKNDKIHFRCSQPQCGAKLNAPLVFAGKRAKCSACGTKVLVPASTDQAASKSIAPKDLTAANELYEAAKSEILAASEDAKTPVVRPTLTPDDQLIVPVVAYASIGARIKGFIVGALAGFIAVPLFIGIVGLLMFLLFGGLNVLSGGDDLVRMDNVAIRFKTFDNTTVTVLVCMTAVLWPIGVIGGAVEGMKWVSEAAAIPAYLKSRKDLSMILGALLNRSAHVRNCAVCRIGDIKDQGALVFPIMLEMLQGKSFDIRIDVARAMAKLGSVAEEAIPAIIDLLREIPSGKAGVRPLMLLAECLGDFGPPAHLAIPSLRKRGKNLGQGVEEAIREAIAKIDPNSDSREQSS